MQEDRKLLASLKEVYTSADRALNAIYKLLYAEMDGAARAKLVKAQRAWLVFRDANAVLHADYLRGAANTASETALYTVLGQVTTARFKELEAIRAERNAARKS